MDANTLKKSAADAALQYVRDDTVVGVGTGSTVNYFIEALAARKARIDGAVASSEASATRLRALHIPVMELNDTDGCDVYVDGADEVTEHLAMVKGGGAALTREKIVAQASRTARELVKLGGMPQLRDGVTTDNGNLILDVRGLTILNPVELETAINQIPGVVTNGIFARRPADVLLLATPEGVRTIKRR